MAKGKCFGFVFLLCLFSSSFALRILKDSVMMDPSKMVHPDHEVTRNLSEEDSLQPRDKQQSMPGEPEDMFKPEGNEKQDHMEKFEKVKQDHIVKPDEKEKQDRVEELEKVKQDHIANPDDKEKQDRVEKSDEDPDLIKRPSHVLQSMAGEPDPDHVKPFHELQSMAGEPDPDHVVNPSYELQSMPGTPDPDHVFKPNGFGEGIGYGSGSGFGEGIGYGGGGSGFGEGIGSGGGSGFGEGIGSGGGTGIGIGQGSGSGPGQPNCGPVHGAPGSGPGIGIGIGGPSGGRGPGTTIPPITVPGTTIPPITVPGTTIPGFTIPGVTVPGYGPGGGCQNGGCNPSAPYYRPPIYQQPNCPHCPPYAEEDKHESDERTMTEALAPTSDEVHL